MNLILIILFKEQLNLLNYDYFSLNIEIQKFVCKKYFIKLYINYNSKLHNIIYTL